MRYCRPPPQQKNRPKFVTSPSSPKIFSPPQYSNFLLPPSTGNGCFCIFYIWLLPTNTCSYFWRYYNWLDAIIIDFWRSWNYTLKKYLFTIILFYCFMYDDLSFINTMQKTVKIFQKNCFNSQDGWEKTSHPGISAEWYRQNTELSRSIISKVY